MSPDSLPGDQPIGEILVQEGVVRQKDIDEALELQASEGGRLCVNLIRLGCVSSDKLSRFFQEYFGFIPFRFQDIVTDPEAPSLIPAEVARYYKLVPLSKEGKRLSVAFCEGTEQLSRLSAALEELTGLKVEPVLSPEPIILEALDNHYGSARVKGLYWRSVGDNLLVLQDKEADIRPIALEKLDDSFSEIEWLRSVLSHAVKKKLLEITFEPGDKSCEVYFSDGKKKQKVAILPPSVDRNLFRFLRKLVRTESSAQPDESYRAALQVEKRAMALEVHFLSTVLGERAVLRLRDEKALKGSMEMWLAEYLDAASLADSFWDAKQGVWILTGPAESGRTQFYYSLLERAAEEGKSPFSLERQVETYVRGVQQTVWSEAWTAQEALASLAGQAPGCMGVSEMEEGRHAERIFFSGTRFPILSILTSFDVYSALGWLLKHNLRSPIKAGLCKGFFGMRGYPPLCDSCAEAYTYSDEDKSILERFGMASDELIFTASGCPDCQRRIHENRVFVLETLSVDEALIDKFSDSSYPADAWREEALKSGKPLSFRRAFEAAKARKIDARALFRSAPVF